MQSEAKVLVTGNVYRHNPYTHYIGKTHLMSQHLSLNMPRLNQNQRIQGLTMLARGDNVSNVSGAFGCHRNTIIRLRQRFQQTGGVADRRRPGRPRVTIPRTDRFITLTHLRCLFQTATSSARQYGISEQTVLRRLRQARQPIWPRRPYVGQVLTACHRAARLQWAQRHFHWGDSSGLGFYSLMSLGLTLVIMTVEFEFLEEEGNVLLIIVSLRGTDLEVGVLRYGVALWAEGKQISLLCKATSLLKVTLTTFCSLKLFLSFKDMGLQYWCMIMQGLMLQGYFDSFYPEITLTYYLGMPCHRIWIRLSTSGIILVERFELKGTDTILGIWKTP